MGLPHGGGGGMALKRRSKGAMGVGATELQGAGGGANKTRGLALTRRMPSLTCASCNKVHKLSATLKAIDQTISLEPFSTTQMGVLSPPIPT